MGGLCCCLCAQRVGCMQCLVPGDEVFFFRCGSGDGLDLAEGDEAGDLGLLEDLLAVELGHLRVLGVLLQLCVAGADFFLARVLGDAGLLERVVGGGVDVLLVENQVVLVLLLEADLLATGEDLVTSVLLIPLGERGGHVHLLAA